MNKNVLWAAVIFLMLTYISAFTIRYVIIDVKANPHDAKDSITQMLYSLSAKHNIPSNLQKNLAQVYLSSTHCEKHNCKMYIFYLDITLILNYSFMHDMYIGKSSPCLSFIIL